MNAAFGKAMKEVRAQEAKLQAKKDSYRRDAIKEINSIIAMFGIKASELDFKGTCAVKAEEPAAPAAEKKDRKPAQAKYRAPDGTTWSGRGRTKKAIQDALDAGMKLEDMLIK